MKTILLFALCFFVVADISLGQTKILLLSGKTKEVKQYEVKGDWVFYKKIDDPKDKMHKLDKFEVFSAILADGTEEVIYDPDTSFEGDPSVERVRKYIKGEQYSMATYPCRFNSGAKNYDNHVGAVFVGAASGFAGYYGPIGVFTYAIILSRFNPKIPFTDSIPPEIFNSDEFKLGYQKHARNKKIKQSLIIGGISFGVSFALLAILQ